MRKYKLASRENREETDLRNYKHIIKETVHHICPNEKVKVVKDGYYLSDSVSRGDKIKIGRALARTELGVYCMNRPILFVGEQVPIKKKE